MVENREELRIGRVAPQELGRVEEGEDGGDHRAELRDLQEEALQAGGVGIALQHLLVEAGDEGGGCRRPLGRPCCRRWCDW